MFCVGASQCRRPLDRCAPGALRRARPLMARHSDTARGRRRVLPRRSCATTRISPSPRGSRRDRCAATSPVSTRSAGTPTTSATRAVIAPWQCDGSGAGATRHAKASTTTSARIPCSSRSPTPSDRFQLDAQPFIDLIDANMQDQRIDRYEDWPALRGYCTLSAAPVGRIVLRLFDIDDAGAQCRSATTSASASSSPTSPRTSPSTRASAARTCCRATFASTASTARLGRCASARARSSQSGVAARGAGTAAIAGSTRPLSPRRRCDPRRGRGARYRTATQRPAVDRAARVRIAGAALSSGLRRDAARPAPAHARPREPVTGMLDTPTAPDMRAAGALLRGHGAPRGRQLLLGFHRAATPAAHRQSTRCTTSRGRWTTTQTSTVARRATHASSIIAAVFARRAPATAPTR